MRETRIILRSNNFSSDQNSSMSSVSIMNSSNASTPPTDVLLQFNMFLCGVHCIQTDLNEAYHFRAVETTKISPMKVFDRNTPMPLSPANQYDKKQTGVAQKYFRKWAAFLQNTPGVFVMIIKRDLGEYFQNNDTAQHVIKFAFSMARHHVFCEDFARIRERGRAAASTGDSSPFQPYLDELKRWKFCEEDVVFMNILHQTVFPYVDEKILKSRTVRISGTDITVPYETLNMCPEIANSQQNTSSVQ